MADPAPKDEPTKAKPYRFTWGYPCAYDFPGQTREIEPGEIVEWPDGPPDANWVEVDPKELKAEEKKTEAKVAPPTGEDKTKE